MDFLLRVGLARLRQRCLPSLASQSRWGEQQLPFGNSNRRRSLQAECRCARYSGVGAVIDGILYYTGGSHDNEMWKGTPETS